ncbi:MAG: hypothetical protein NC098_04205 [Lachnoclostridium sp.]|nr:hypothetical protein [Lachnoclostridium sp.]
MTIDEFKKSWSNIDVGTPATEETIARFEKRMRDREVSTMRDSLSRASLRLGLVAFVSPLLMVPFWSISPALVIVTWAFFWIMSMINFRFTYIFSHLDYCKLSAKEALSQTIKIEQMRNRSKVFGISLLIPLLCFMAYTFNKMGEPYIMVGCICGVVIGLAIGIAINYHFMTTFRAMKAELDDIE